MGLETTIQISEEIALKIAEKDTENENKDYLSSQNKTTNVSWRAYSLVQPLSTERRGEMDICISNLDIDPTDQKYSLLIKKVAFLITGIWTGGKDRKNVPFDMKFCIENNSPIQINQEILTALDNWNMR